MQNKGYIERFLMLTIKILHKRNTFNIYNKESNWYGNARSKINYQKPKKEITIAYSFSSAVLH